MNASAVLTLSMMNETAARALSEVLSPDNEGIPKGMRFSQELRHGKIRIVAASTSPSTALSTMLAILRDAALFQEVWLLSRDRTTSGPGSKKN